MSTPNTLPIFALGEESTWEDLENGMAASVEWQNTKPGRIGPLLGFAPMLEPADLDTWEPVKTGLENVLIVSIARSADEVLLKACRRAEDELGELKLAGVFPAVRCDYEKPIPEVYRLMGEAGIAAFASLGLGKDDPSFFFLRGREAVLAFDRSLRWVTRK